MANYQSSKARYLHLASDADGEAARFQRGCCGCFSEDLRNIFLIAVIAVSHVGFFLFTIFWYMSYMEIDNDSDFKANYTGPYSVSSAMDNLYLLAWIVGAVTVIGFLCLFEAINQLFHGVFMYSIAKALRYGAIFLTLVVYTFDVLAWNQLKQYGFNSSFYESGTPQVFAFIFMLCYAGVTQLVDNMNTMVLLTSYGARDMEDDDKNKYRTPRDMEDDKNKYRTRFYGGKV